MFGFGGIDDARRAIGVNLRESAEDQAADVSEDGSAASRDAVLGSEPLELAQRMVNALGGLERL